MADGSLIFDTKINPSGFSSGLSKIGRAAKTGLKVAGAALIGMSGYALKVGMDFDASMSKLSAISGATGKDLTALRNKAKEMGAATKFSATESAEAMTELAAAGFSTKEIMGAIPGLLDLAASSGESLSTSADIASSTIRGFGLSAKDAGHVADVLAMNANKTNDAVADTGEAFKYIAPVAKAAGISMEETAAAVGILANAGIKGGQAGTVLRGALTRLINPSGEAKAKMDELGMSFYDAQGKMLPLEGILQQLKDGTKGLTQEQKNQALATIFGQEALSGMLALIDAGPDQLSKLTKAYENSDGAAKKMADTMQNNLKGKITILKSSLEGLGIAVYDKMKKPLTEAVDSATGSLNKLTRSMNSGKLSAAFDSLGTSIAGLVSGGVNLLTNALPPLISGLSWFLSHGKGVASTIIGIGVSLKVMQNIKNISKALNMASTGFSLFSSVVTSNLSLATKATELFTLATMSIPSTALIAGALGIAAALGTYIAISIASGSETDKNVEKTKALTEAYKENHKALQEHRIERQKKIDDSTTEASQAEMLAGKIESLAQKERKSAEEKKLLKAYVDQLNEVMPNLNLKYDEETDKLNQSTEAIHAKIAAMKEEALATAYRSAMKDVVKDIVKTEKEMAKAEKQVETNTKLSTKAHKELNKAIKARNDAGVEETDVFNKYNEKVDDAQANVKKYDTALKKSRKTLQGHKDDLAKSKKELDGYGDSAAKAAVKSESFNQLLEKCAEAGVKVPKSVSEGIQNGMYAIPETVEQMQSLISFDKMVKKAGLSGEDIPKSVSEGIMSGKYQVPQSVDELNNLISFDKLAQKAQKAGVEIPSSVSNGIISGQYAVPKSMSQLKALIKYDDLVTKAKEKGIEIPEYLSKGIADGSISPKQAAKKLNKIVKDALKDDGSTEKSGSSTVSSYDKGIKKKMSVPPETAREMKENVKAKLKDNGEFNPLGSLSTTNYGKGLGSVAAIVNSISGGIKNGALNSISGGDFRGRGSTSGNNYGYGIGGTKGNASNNANAVKRSALGGITGGDFWGKGSGSGNNYGGGIGSQTGYVGGKAAGLRGSAEANVSGGNSYGLGQAFGSGYANGIGSMGGAVAAAAQALVNTALAKIQAAQNSHSPAKETIELGNDFGQGYAIGIESKKDFVKNSSIGLVNTALNSLNTKKSFSDYINFEHWNLLKESAMTLVDNFVKSANIPNLSTAGGYGQTGTTNIFNQTNTFTSEGPLNPSKQAVEMRMSVNRMFWKTGGKK